MCVHIYIYNSRRTYLHIRTYIQAYIDAYINAYIIHIDVQAWLSVEGGGAKQFFCAIKGCQNESRPHYNSN